MAEDNKWEKIDKRISKRKNDVPQPGKRGSKKNSLYKSKGNMPVNNPDKLGPVARYKIKKANQYYTVEQWKEVYREKLSVWRKRVKTEADLSKNEILLAYEEELERINKDHIEQLRIMGITNFESKSEAIMELGQKASKLLKRIDTEDVPETIRNKNVDAIMNMYEKLFERIESDEIDNKFSKEE